MFSNNRDTGMGVNDSREFTNRKSGKERLKRLRKLRYVKYEIFYLFCGISNPTSLVSKLRLFAG